MTNWKERIPKDGYSFNEVLAEIKRRATGEYTIMPKEARARFAAGRRELEAMYRISALIAEFLEKNALTPEELQKILISFNGEDATNMVETLLCPIRHSKTKNRVDDSLATSGLVDELYPGTDVQRS